jgi:hypothetical protein
MSFSGIPMPFIGTKEEYQKHMARQEIKKRTANLISVCQWRYWLRTEVVVNWPQGWTPQDHLGNSAESADPNVWYRAWLETNVGPQGWAWDWRINKVYVPDNNPLIEVRDSLKIKFRKAADATAFALKWA